MSDDSAAVRVTMPDGDDLEIRGPHAKAIADRMQNDPRFFGPPERLVEMVAEMRRRAVAG